MPFADAIVALRGIRSEDLVKQISILFENVARLDVPSVIAAWQAVDACMIGVEIDSPERKFMQKIKGACVARMVALLHSASLEEKHILRMSFSEVVDGMDKGKFR